MTKVLLLISGLLEKRQDDQYMDEDSQETSPISKGAIQVWISARGSTKTIRSQAQRFADEHGLSLLDSNFPQPSGYVLHFTNDGIFLFDPGDPEDKGYRVEFSDIDLRTGPGNLSRKQPLPKAIGRDSHTIVDATAGLGHDAVLLACMGYEVWAVERSPIIGTLLQDGLHRALEQPELAERIGGRLHVTIGDAKEYLESMTARPEVVYVDPMYPPKRKRSALAKKQIRLVRDVVGDDVDALALGRTALEIASRRVVVKRPNHAQPLLGKPDLCFEGKLARYDVYLKH